jgi:hypothetical protein
MSEKLLQDYNTECLLDIIENDGESILHDVPMSLGPLLNSISVRFVEEFPSPASKKLDENGVPFATRYPGERPTFAYSTFSYEVAPGVFIASPNEFTHAEDLERTPSFFVNARHSNGREYVFNIDDLLEAVDAEPLGQRYPVVAFGSNANPGQLFQKFNDLHGADKDIVPTLKAKVKGVVPVYVARIGLNGYVFTDLAPTADSSAECEVFVNFLSKLQLEAMDKTEKAYTLCEVPGVKIETSDRPEYETCAYLYVGRDDDMGARLLADGQGRPIRLAELKADGEELDKEFGVMTQDEVQKYIFDIAADAIADALLLDHLPRDELDIIRMIINRSKDRRLSRLRELNEQQSSPQPLGRLITKNKIQKAIEATGKTLPNNNIRSRIPKNRQDIPVEEAKSFHELLQ